MFHLPPPQGQPVIVDRGHMHHALQARESLPRRPLHLVKCSCCGQPCESPTLHNALCRYCRHPRS